MHIYFFIILTIITIIIVLYQTPNIENLINIKPSTQPVSWQRNKCNYIMNDTLKAVLEQNNLKQTNNDDKRWQLYLPCSYNNIKKEIDMMTPDNELQKFFIIDNADQLAAKNLLWENIINKYGREKSKLIMPDTYVLYKSKDMEEFKKNYDKSKLYIMKRNVQRQEGLKITKDYNEIVNATKDNYVIVQELLQNPYLLNKRKINMRFYILVICNKGEIDYLVHNNGFMYYTKEFYTANNDAVDNNITTGYIDRKVYDVNPLTHEDYRKYLDSDRQLTDIEKSTKLTSKLSEYVFNNIYKTLHLALSSLSGNICKNPKMDTSYTFELFGADIAVNNQLEAQIMEINKGPDMGAKDARDKAVKTKVTTDILRVMKIINDNESHEFIDLSNY